MNWSLPEFDCREMVGCGSAVVGKLTFTVVVFVSFLADGLDEDGGG
jgi:hypothetical protein